MPFEYLRQSLLKVGTIGRWLMVHVYSALFTIHPINYIDCKDNR